MHAARPTPPTPCRRAGCSLLWVRWPLLLHGAVFWHMNARIPRSHAAVCPVPSVICGSLTGTKPRTAHTSWGEGGCGGICSPDQGRGDQDCSSGASGRRKQQQTAHSRVLDLERPVRQSAISALSDGPKSSGKLDPQSPPYHRGCLCLGHGVCVDCTPLNNPNLRRTWP